jgi:hypothetical protein
MNFSSASIDYNYTCVSLLSGVAFESIPGDGSTFWFTACLKKKEG